jgi:hypothetical protein
VVVVVLAEVLAPERLAPQALSVATALAAPAMLAREEPEVRLVVVVVVSDQNGRWPETLAPPQVQGEAVGAIRPVRGVAVAITAEVVAAARRAALASKASLLSAIRQPLRLTVSISILLPENGRSPLIVFLSAILLLAAAQAVAVAEVVAAV